MKTLRQLCKLSGHRWTGIALHDNGIPSGDLVGEPMRLCEALARSHHSPVVLPSDMISCPGARRSLGLDSQTPTELGRRMSEKTGTSRDLARRIVADTPRLVQPPSALTLGWVAAPDIVVAYLNPEAAMRLTRQWQQAFGSTLALAASSFMAICGGVVARAHNLGQTCVSFGCPDSRQYGHIESGWLVVGMPYRVAEQLFQGARSSPARRRT